jgi:homoserine O-acetyltransferase
MIRMPLALMMALAFALPARAEELIAPTAPESLLERPFGLKNGLIVTKQVLQLPTHRFVDGKRLPVALSYETYGRLNARRDNAILICHFFSGTAHAAGRHAPGDAQAGYWDDIIGPGKPLDTDRFFIVSSDILANVNAHDPTIKTTAPHSIDPATGRPYGGTFPTVSIRDMVAVQRALMDHLEIPRWHTVMGASLGGMQALQWAVSYPDRVERAVSVAASGRADAYNQGLCQIMIDAIRTDPDWKDGAYYGQQPPNRGLASAWKLLFVHTQSRQGLERSSGAASSRRFIETLEARAKARIGQLDANAWLSLSEAGRDFDLGAGYPDYRSALSRIQAKVMAIAAEGDLLYPPELIRSDLVAPLEALGKPARYHLLPTPAGHLGAVTDIENVSDVLRDFLR